MRSPSDSWLSDTSRAARREFRARCWLLVAMGKILVRL
jgi:hypothetical protein